MLVNPKTGQIYVYGLIGEIFEGGIGDSSLLVALDQLEGKRARVHINSPGGMAYDGIAMYNTLKHYAGGVDTIVDSLAASAAAIVAAAGERRITLTGGQWMIHRAMGRAFGNREELTAELPKRIAQLDAMDSSQQEIFGKLLGDGVDVMALLSAQTWFTGDEAVAAGLSTERSNELAIQPQVAAWFRHPPESIAAYSPEAIVPKFAVRRQAAALRRSLVR